MRGVDLLQRLEWAAVAAVGLLLYPLTGQGWLVFLLLILLPDISIAAYLAGPRIGAIAYNAVHTVIAPLALLGYGMVADLERASAIGLIWLIHIAVDRALGYGLKLPTGFRDTHLGHIGAKRRRVPTSR